MRFVNCARGRVVDYTGVQWSLSTSRDGALSNFEYLEWQTGRAEFRGSFSTVAEHVKRPVVS